MFDKFEKIAFFISHSEEIFPVSFIVKDTAVICKTIKCVFYTAIFGGSFHPQKSDLGR